MRHPLHDYTSGAGYFITFCTRNRQPILGSIDQSSCRLTRAGTIVTETWLELPDRYPRVILDALQIMPDHVHCIVILTDVSLVNIAAVDPRVSHPLRATSLAEVMRGFKSLSAKRINLETGQVGRPVWQTGYMDRVIRNETELEKYRGYLQTNPLRQSL